MRGHLFDHLPVSVARFVELPPRLVTAAEEIPCQVFVLPVRSIRLKALLEKSNPFVLFPVEDRETSADERVVAAFRFAVRLDSCQHFPGAVSHIGPDRVVEQDEPEKMIERIALERVLVLDDRSARQIGGHDERLGIGPVLLEYLPDPPERLAILAAAAKGLGLLHLHVVPLPRERAIDPHLVVPLIKAAENPQNRCLAIRDRNLDVEQLRFAQGLVIARLIAKFPRPVEALDGRIPLHPFLENSRELEVVVDRVGGDRKERLDSLKGLPHESVDALPVIWFDRQAAFQVVETLPPLRGRDRQRVPVNPVEKSDLSGDEQGARFAGREPERYARLVGGGRGPFDGLSDLGDDLGEQEMIGALRRRHRYRLSHDPLRLLEKGLALRGHLSRELLVDRLFQRRQIDFVSISGRRKSGGDRSRLGSHEIVRLAHALNGAKIDEKRIAAVEVARLLEHLGRLDFRILVHGQKVIEARLLELGVRGGEIAIELDVGHGRTHGLDGEHPHEGDHDQREHAAHGRRAQGNGHRPVLGVRMAALPRHVDRRVPDPDHGGEDEAVGRDLVEVEVEEAVDQHGEAGGERPSGDPAAKDVAPRERLAGERHKDEEDPRDGDQSADHAGLADYLDPVVVGKGGRLVAEMGRLIPLEGLLERPQPCSKDRIVADHGERRLPEIETRLPRERFARRHLPHPVDDLVRVSAEKEAQDGHDQEEHGESVLARPARHSKKEKEGDPRPHGGARSGAREGKEDGDRHDDDEDAEQSLVVDALRRHRLERLDLEAPSPDAARRERHAEPHCHGNDHFEEPREVVLVDEGTRDRVARHGHLVPEDALAAPHILDETIDCLEGAHGDHRRDHGEHLEARSEGVDDDEEHEKDRDDPPQFPRGVIGSERECSRSSRIRRTGQRRLINLGRGRRDGFQDALGERHELRANNEDEEADQHEDRIAHEHDLPTPRRLQEPDEDHDQGKNEKRVLGPRRHRSHGHGREHDHGHEHGEHDPIEDV